MVASDGMAVPNSIPIRCRQNAVTKSEFAAMPVRLLLLPLSLSFFFSLPLCCSSFGRFHVLIVIVGILSWYRICHLQIPVSLFARQSNNRLDETEHQWQQQEQYPPNIPTQSTGRSILVVANKATNSEWHAWFHGRCQ